MHFNDIRAGSVADRSQLYKDIAGGPFFGFNRPGAKVSQGLIDSFWMQGMMAGHKNAYDCIKAFSETDFTEDLKRFDVPTQVIHGDDDQIVPIQAAGLGSAKLVKNAKLLVYPGAPHGLTDTHKARGEHRPAGIHQVVSCVAMQRTACGPSARRATFCQARALERAMAM